MGTTFEQACYDYLMKYSDDGTLQSGIENLVKDTGRDDYEEHVGYIVTGRLSYSGKYNGKDYDLWDEEAEEAECRRNKNLRYYMDETSAPYPEGGNPFGTTEEDREFERKLVAKYNLVLKEESGQGDAHMFEIRKIKSDYSDYENETDVPTDVVTALANAFMRHVYCDGILIGRGDINTIAEYPTYMGTTFEQACYDYLMKYSDDGTLQSGIDNLVNDTGYKHYENHVGYIVSGRMLYSGKYNDKDYDLWDEEEEEAEFRKKNNGGVSNGNGNNDAGGFIAGIDGRRNS
jgi:uncharacterized protein (UPF0297 family)